MANVPVYVTQIEKWWGGVIAFAAGHGITLPELSMNVDNATKVITDFLTNNGDNVVNTTIDITTSILGALVNFLLALVFSVYLLAQKETLMAQAKRLLLAAIPKKAAGRTMHILSLTNNAFSSFVTGQVTEAFILGTLCCLGMLILRLPYALPVSVIISFTSLIPIFGAWIGAATGAFLIVFVSPIKALTFLIFLLILQQVEGNLIYPRVVGKSVGLPGPVGPGGGDHRRRRLRRYGHAFGCAGVLGGVCPGAWISFAPGRQRRAGTRSESRSPPTRRSTQRKSKQENPRRAERLPGKGRHSHICECLPSFYRYIAAAGAGRQKYKSRPKEGRLCRWRENGLCRQCSF